MNECYWQISRDRFIANVLGDDIFRPRLTQTDIRIRPKLMSLNVAYLKAH